jgi:hypothetical protein
MWHQPDGGLGNFPDRFRIVTKILRGRCNNTGRPGMRRLNPVPVPYTLEIRRGKVKWLNRSSLDDVSGKNTKTVENVFAI